MTHQIVVYHTLMAGHYEEVIVEGRRALEKFPGFLRPHGRIGDALWVLGRYQEALVEYEAFWGSENNRFRTFQGGFARLGPTGAWKELADRSVERAKVVDIHPMTIAKRYAFAGESDPAFEWLEEAYHARSAMLLHAPFSPEFESLQSDPRFEALMRRIGIPRFTEQGTQ